MVALANLCATLDVSIQQLAAGLAILALLVALTWYVSHPRMAPTVSRAHNYKKITSAISAR